MIHRKLLILHSYATSRVRISCKILLFRQFALSGSLPISYATIYHRRDASILKSLNPVDSNPQSWQFDCFFGDKTIVLSSIMNFVESWG